MGQGFRAVYLATGGQKGRPLDIEGEGLKGVCDSLEFLRARGLGRKIRPGKRVAVIGGGNAALDAARSALRLGAEKVFILYRRTREEMPAYEEEIEEALREGIELRELVAPMRILGKRGRVTGIEMIKMRLGEADDDGRRRPEPVADSRFVIDCETVLPAIGQIASTEVAADARISDGRIFADPAAFQTSLTGVFAGGDVVTGGSTVIEAVAHGQRAAVAIDRYLGGTGMLPLDLLVSTNRPSDEKLMESASRLEEPMLPVAERSGNFREVVAGVSRSGACAEAGRCLRCDLEKLTS